MIVVSVIDKNYLFIQFDFVVLKNILMAVAKMTFNYVYVTKCLENF